MFENPANYVWLIPGLPVLGAIVTAAFGKAFLKSQSHWPCVIAAVIACILSIFAMNSVLNGFEGTAINYVWFAAGNVDVGFSLRLDGLTAIMLCAVTFIGSLIAIYSIGYMHGDPGYYRYFAAVSLFLASMTGLVLADNYVLLYACWEGVGLCSYLLIGFWFSKPSAAAAARKAFLVTRLGDIGLFLGILFLWINCGYSLDFENIFAQATTLAQDSPATLTLICLLLFCGAVGKSAQFPLHVWLPDAMEGPSSVSALIHAATMVTAGVYLVARSIPLFALSPTAQLTVAIIGAFTALLAALMALTQTDLKRVLAYSTISQLGYMFLALGSAIIPELWLRNPESSIEESLAHLREHSLVEVGVVAAIFHLFTHAFFKALLFLGAGSVMHAMGDVIDMRRFGGLRKLLPHTHWTFLCGSAALAGLPLLSGFWSKDEILHVAYEASMDGSIGSIYFILFLSGLFTAGLTAFYTFRAYFMTFWGEEVIPPEAGHHAHESPMVMLVPLMILAAGAVGVGFVLGPTHLFGGVLSHHWMEHSFGETLLPPPEHYHGMNYLLMVISSIVALAGAGLAWFLYVKNPELAAKLPQLTSVTYSLSRNRFYIDEIYVATVVKPLSIFSQICGFFDRHFVDGLVNFCGYVPAILGRMFSPVQNGLLQFYALLMALGVAGFLIAVLLR